MLGTCKKSSLQVLLIYSGIRKAYNDLIPMHHKLDLQMLMLYNIMIVETCQVHGPTTTFNSVGYRFSVLIHKLLYTDHTLLEFQKLTNIKYLVQV